MKNIQPSKICFGSMRMNEHSFALKHWVELFQYISEKGLDTFHSSSEYESFSKFCEALKEANLSKKIQHIVKLAEPNFHLHLFDQEEFNRKVEFYLNELRCEQIIVQWMWRGNLEDHKKRLSDFEDQSSKLSETIELLKKNSKIKSFMVFPYDVDFAMKSIQYNFVDGLVVYRNKFEREYDEAILEAGLLEKKSYILRPFFAGKGLEKNENPSEIFYEAINLPSIEGGIVSISSKEKFDQLMGFNKID